jgi:hypothetical protein
MLSHLRLENQPDGISIRNKLVLEDHLGAVVVEGANLKPAHLGWKSQRIKIHMLGKRFLDSSLLYWLRTQENFLLFT